MASFLNPNDPPQPRAGVYGWFMSLPDGLRCLYLGQAGQRASAKEKGTLLRGVTELFRESFSSDSPHYKRLDTDFVVGTAIRFFEDRSVPVFWKHLSNDPGEEIRLAVELQPYIQEPTRPRLLPNLKIPMDERHYWKWPGANHEECRAKLREADVRVRDQLESLLAIKPLRANAGGAMLDHLGRG